MRTKAPEILPIFRSDLQARILSALLLDPGAELSQADLGRRTGGSRAGIHRELARLLGAGILESRAVGRTRLYRAATASPLHRPLRTLVQRTLGVEQQLTDRLRELGGVEAAAIYGSWAAGILGPTSDIDLLVVGDVDRAELLDLVRDVEQAAGREISVSAFRRDELERKLRDGSGFLVTVLERPLKMLLGSLPDGPR